MNIAQKAFAVLRFELLRSLTASRVSVWLVLALFPPAIVLLVLINDPPVQFPLLSLGIPMMVLIPQAMCLLGLLLWASPIVYAELEGKTWIYLAVRPRGKTAVLLGKYLTALVWTVTACLMGLTLTVPLATRFKMDSYEYSFEEPFEEVESKTTTWVAESDAEQEYAVENALHLWLVFALLIVLSSLAYGAIFVLIGAIFHRRAMVIAVAYTMISEFVVTWIPAVINQFTVGYHLRCLLQAWMNWYDLPPRVNPVLFGAESAGQHVLLMLGATATLLVVANTVVNLREYIAAAEA